MCFFQENQSLKTTATLKVIIGERGRFMPLNQNCNASSIWSQKNSVLYVCSYTSWKKIHKKNPAYGRHQLSRPMRIVVPIQFWRVCVIYRSSPKSGLGPRENADLVHAKVGTWSTQKFWLGSLRNTFPFLGLYSRSRSRSNSGTHPCF